MSAISNTKLDTLLSEIKNGKIIDDQLVTKSKSSFYWACRRVICLFCCLFRIDAFSHMRANRVAMNLFNYWRDNQLAENPENTKKVIEILDILDKKTHEKYKTIKRIRTLLSLTVNIASKCERQKQLAPADQSILNADVFKKIQSEIFNYCYLSFFKDDYLEKRNQDYGFSVFFNGKYSKENPRVSFYISKKDTHLPIDLRVYFIGHEADFANIFLELEEEDEQGKRSFDLVTGKYYQYLDVSEQEASSLRNDFQNIIPQMVNWADNRVNGAFRQPYTLYLKKYTGILTSLIGPRAPLFLEQKISVIEQMITAVKLLHEKGQAHLNICLDQIVYQKLRDGNYRVRFRNLKSPIKIEDQIQSQSDHPDLFVFRALLARAPTVDSKTVWINSFKKRQTKMDLWDLGLVISSILLSEYMTVETQAGKRVVPALKSIESVVYKLNGSQQISSEEVQEAIDQECSGKKDASEDLIMKNLWDLVSQMLQVDYAKRIDAKKAYEEIKRIKLSYKFYSQD